MRVTKASPASRRSKARPARPASRPNPRALILIDGEPIRKKARKAYEKARRDLDNARLQLDQFYTQDRPAFQRWMNTTFGQQVTALRELSRLVSEKQQLIAEIDYFAWEQGVSEAEAFAAVLRRREQPEAPPVPRCCLCWGPLRPAYGTAPYAISGRNGTI